MKHLTEAQLNEYLDGELGTRAQQAAEAHLAGCTACRKALADLATVATALACLPEEALERDLAAPVLDRLPRPRPGIGWKLLLSAQAGFALGLVLLVGANLRSLLEIPFLGAFLTLSLPVIELPAFQVPTLAFPAFETQPSTAQLAFLAAAALLLWGVGNAILLKNGNRVQE
jgi:hypothetical protein